MHIGIRGPSNLFGHPTDDQIDALESELQYLDKSHPHSSVTKLVFGHFPLSFTASSKRGGRYETIFARNSVSAYICGHLHAKFSKKLWRRHSVEVTYDTSNDSRVPNRVNRQFWEWELGDWKEFKLIRILAIDEGEVSFVDVELSTKQDNFETAILITYPTDSSSMNRLAQAPQSQILRNDINSLVFSVTPIINVTARVFDSSRAFKIVEEVPLLPDTSDTAIINNSLYRAKWNAENYRNDLSATRYWLQVFVLDSEGKQTVSSPRPFSVEGKTAAEYPSTWLAFLVIGFKWEAFYSILLWSNLCFLFMLLFLPKLLNQFMDKSASYQKWAASISISSPIQQRRVFFSVLWFLLEGSRSREVWYSMVIYLLCLLRLPWFWGYVTSENGDIAPMYMFGWKISSSITENASDGSWIGNPDVLTITLPFMYLVVTSLLLLVYSLFAERSAACFQSSARRTVGREQQSFNSSDAKTTSYIHTWRRQRIYLLFACVIVTCIHLKQFCALQSAYGAAPVALSPVFSWVPPLLLAAAIYSTSKA